jgi:hypothetical protein
MKFEYSVMNIGTMSSENFKMFLDNMGENNWELVQIENSNAIFKRPKVENKKQLLNESIEQSYTKE